MAPPKPHLVSQNESPIHSYVTLHQVQWRHQNRTWYLRTNHPFTVTSRCTRSNGATKTAPGISGRIHSYVKLHQVQWRHQNTPMSNLKKLAHCSRHVQRRRQPNTVKPKRAMSSTVADLELRHDIFMELFVQRSEFNSG